MTEESLEVVAWVTTGFSGKSNTRRAFTVAKADADQQHTNWLPHYKSVTTDALCRLTDAQRLLSQRDARIAELEHEKEVLRDSIQGRYDMQAASVGGEREAFEAGLNPHSRRRNEQGDYVIPEIQDRWDGWKARAALSPAGGGVDKLLDMNELSNVIRSIVGWSNMGAGRLAEAICDRLNAKPLANSQEGEKS